MNDIPTTTQGISAFRIFAPLLLALIIISVIYALGIHGEYGNLEELALGENTHAYYAKSGGIPVHCSDLRDAHICLDGFRQRGATRAALWLGNSQLHAINQFRAGDENAPSLLYKKLRSHGLDLLTFSQPNANLQEHYVLFTYLQERLPVRLLILPIVFDDMRENGVRSTIGSALKDSSTRNALETTDTGRRLLFKNLGNGGDENEDTAGLAQTMQDHAERTLNGWLGTNVQAWSDRSNMRGTVFISLYKLRNFLFGIKPTTKRRLIRAIYDENLQALRSILGRASEKDIRIVLYVVPLRNDVEPPYDLSEYEKFKQDIENLARTNRSTLVNLENLVPAEFWGTKASTTLSEDPELDFMHFQGAGHRLLADALDRTIGNTTRDAGQ